MFDNIGGKIKGLAKVICWIGIIASVIIGFTMFTTEMFLVGFLIIVLGSLFSWIGSFTAYGFGQLIENTDKMVEYSELKEYGETSWTCNICDTANKPNAKHCTNCGQGRYDVPEETTTLQGQWECSKCGNVWEGNVPFCTCGEERNKK